MKSSKIMDFLFGYEKTEENFNNSRLAGLGKKFTDNPIGGGVGSAYARKLLRNPISEFLSHLSHDLASASMRVYGIAIMSFGLLTLLINFADYYFRALPTSPAAKLIVGLVFAALSIPLILTDEPTVDFLQNHRITNALFFEILCLRRPRRTARREREAGALDWIIPIGFGALIAILGFFLPLGAVLIAVAAIIFIALSISSPEFSFLITVFSIPAIPLIPHSSLVLAALIGITIISFLSKVILGKRLWHFELYDILIVMFIIFTFVSGIFNKGIDSFDSSLILIVLILSYFLAGNIIINRRIADNTVNLILTSSVPTAIYAIVQAYTLGSTPEWTDAASGGEGLVRVYSTFGNPNVYAIFVIVALILSLGFAFDPKRRKISALYVLTALLNSVSLALTFTRGAWIAVILSALALIIIKSRKAPRLLLIPAAAIPVAMFLLPSGIIERFLSSFGAPDTSAAYRLSIWRSSLRMFANRIFIGAGVGEEAFTDEFVKFAEEGVVTPHHSHNLFLEIGCELGIFALVIFLFLILTRLRHRATYSAYVNESSCGPISTAAGVATFALLAYGMTDYIWYNSAACMLFWTVFGLGSATLRLSKSEHDERTLFEHSDNSVFEATANITIDTKYE